MTAETVRERAERAAEAAFGPWPVETDDPSWKAFSDGYLAALASLAHPVVVAGVAEVLLGVLHPHHDPDECSDDWHVAQADHVARAVVGWITGGGE